MSHQNPTENNKFVNSSSEKRFGPDDFAKYIMGSFPSPESTVNAPTVAEYFTAVVKDTKFDAETLARVKKSSASVNPGELVLLEIPNTKNVDIMLLSFLPSNVYVRVVGGYTRNRIEGMGYEKRYSNPHSNWFGRSGCSYYEPSVTYTPDELRKIITSLMAMEYGIKDGWDNLHKARFFFKKMQDHFRYDYDALKAQNNSNSPQVRSLRTLFTHSGVCAGFALIFKELCDRNDIPCDYVEGATKENADGSMNMRDGVHAWNVITVEDGSRYLIDVTHGIVYNGKGYTCDLGFGGNERFTNFFHRHPFTFEPDRVKSIASPLSPMTLSYIDADIMASSPQQSTFTNPATPATQEPSAYDKFLEDVMSGKIKINGPVPENLE